MRNTILIVVMFLVLTACAELSPEQQQILLDGLKEQFDKGIISETQYKAGVEAITTGGMSELGRIGLEFGRTALDVVLALVGVRIWRGGVNSRRGTAPTE